VAKTYERFSRNVYTDMGSRSSFWCIFWHIIFGYGIRIDTLKKYVFQQWKLERGEI
jgi:hypothetical protein